MSDNENTQQVNFDEIKQRLGEIKADISDENISLDDSIKLYEEAVKLGMKATDSVDKNLNEFFSESDEQNDDSDNESDNN